LSLAASHSVPDEFASALSFIKGIKPVRLILAIEQERFYAFSFVLFCLILQKIALGVFFPAFFTLLKWRILYCTEDSSISLFAFCLKGSTGAIQSTR
jgi:hypothetical protein